MKTLCVALMQLMPSEKQDNNLRIGLASVKRARAMGADIALFPEMWNCGYRIPEDPEELNALAVTEESDFIEAFRNISRFSGIAVGITFLEKTEGKPKNTIILYDREGNKVYKYSKVHTCDFADEARLQSGEEFVVRELPTAQGPVKVGSMICFDREFPESARILGLMGAELVLMPNACPMEQNRIAALRADAYRNKIGIACCNYPYGHPDCNGHSIAFDGIAWRNEEPGSRDMKVLEAGEQPGIYLVSFPIDEMREYREREVMGERYRKPEKYKVLTD
ncbi:MAG: carbon-nitrogen hydrolase family protein [Lachnospiraceae bacterium]|nr:carbon-nitrogen hydrolase family protein [Lachnospiraceae bacterium]